MRVFQQANSNVNIKKNWRKGKKSLSIQFPNGKWKVADDKLSGKLHSTVDSRDAGTENRKEASKMA